MFALLLGIWIASVSTVDEVPAWFLAVGYGGLGAVGIACGVLVRRGLGGR